MIYLVEDDSSIRELEQYALESSGLETIAFDEATPFWEALTRQKPDLVILDIMLPGEDGMSILKKLRQSAETADLPVILVTAKDSEMDAVRGLDCGADDFIAKPFGVMEFLSRVKAVCRRVSRSHTAPCEPVLRCGPVEMEDSTHTVRSCGQKVALTFKEYSLLKLLLESAGEVVSREIILRKVWDTDVFVESRTLDMHVRSLRQKLGAAGACIHTVRKVGFQFLPDEGSSV